MNLLLLNSDELKDERTVRLSGARARDIVREENLKSGSTLKVGLGGRGISLAAVESLSDDEVILSLGAFEDSPPQLPFDLIVGLSRPQILKKVIFYGSMLGVRSINFVHADNIEKSYGASKELERGRIEKSIELGLGQAVAVDGPRVEVYKSLGDLKERAAELFGASERCKIFADERGEMTIASDSSAELFSTISEYSIAIGPERGWSERERKFFEDEGFHAISLGRRVYRVELALTVIVAQIQVLTELAHNG